MVTAGVYLVARCTPLFAASPTAMYVVGGIGTFTALLAALIALTQNDLKRVLAYSTVSQLGYMFLALGCGAAGAAVFHLFTHAFFKALLFLAAGSVMHAMGNVIDMRRFSGLRRVLPITRATFLCGAGALAGVPLLSGFWSKDEILASAYEAGHAHWFYMLLFWVGLITAGLTAFYTFRAYFLTFEGEEHLPPEAGHHAHESPPVMTVPLVILAIGAVFAGLAVESPVSHWFSSFLGLTPSLRIPAVPETHWGLMTLSSIVAIAGIAVAWWMYRSEPGLAGRFAARVQGLYQLSLNKFHFDELYDIFIVRPLARLADLCRVLDLYVLDGLVDLLGQVPRFLGQLFRPIQNGLVQFYALAMTLSVTVFLTAMLWRLTSR
jgi:NADH-quinone oxidoreductase subunit L